MYILDFPGGWVEKICLPVQGMQDMQKVYIQSLGQEDPLE